MWEQGIGAVSLLNSPGMIWARERLAVPAIAGTRDRVSLHMNNITAWTSLSEVFKMISGPGGKSYKRVKT